MIQRLACLLLGALALGVLTTAAIAQDETPKVEPAGSSKMAVLQGRGYTCRHAAGQAGPPQSQVQH
jgi:hypothetical protein